MAVVYRAEDLTLGRTVAVKILREALGSDPELLERFRREARAAARLNHPNIIAVYDVSPDDQSDNLANYIVMEYVEGTDLRDLIRDRGALPPEHVVDIGCQIAAALEYAHRNDLVHRDIKSQNVLVTPQGKVKVADFGIAVTLGEGSITQSGMVIGSVHYMAPEQAEGRPTTAASDVYALGVVLYEMLAGKQAFEAESFTEIVYKILTEEPTPLLTLRPGLDASVVDLVQRAMHKDPGRRWPTAESMRGALQDVVVDTNPGDPKPTPLAWELPSPEDVSSAATVAARRAWELQKAVDPKARVTVAAKAPASAAVVPVAPRAPASAVRARAASGEAGPVGEPAPTLGTVTTPRKVDAPAAPKSSGAVPALYAGPAAAAPSAGPRTSRTMLFVGVPLVALVGVLAAGLALWAREGSPTGPAPIAPPIAAAPPMLPPLARPTAGTPLPATPSACRIRVTVGTPGATVLLDGDAYAGNVDLPAACGTRHALQIEAPGHEPMALDLVASTDPPRSVELAPLPPLPRPASPRAAAPRPAPRAPATGEPDEGGNADDPPVNLEANPF